MHFQYQFLILEKWFSMTFLRFFESWGLDNWKDSDQYTLWLYCYRKKFVFPSSEHQFHIGRKLRSFVKQCLEFEWSFCFVLQIRFAYFLLENKLLLCWDTFCFHSTILPDKELESISYELPLQKQERCQAAEMETCSSYDATLLQNIPVCLSIRWSAIDFRCSHKAFQFWPWREPLFWDCF